MRHWKLFARIMGIILSFTFLQSGTLGVAAEKVIKVGSVLPLTGSLADTGRYNRAGTQIAVDIINNKYPDLNLPLAKTEGIPNLNNARIEIVWADSKGTRM